MVSSYTNRVESLTYAWISDSGPPASASLYTWSTPGSVLRNCRSSWSDPTNRMHVPSCSSTPSSPSSSASAPSWTSCTSASVTAASPATPTGTPSVGATPGCSPVTGYTGKQSRASPCTPHAAAADRAGSSRNFSPALVCCTKYSPSCRNLSARSGSTSFVMQLCVASGNANVRGNSMYSVRR